MNKQKLPKGWKEIELGKIFTFQKKSTLKAGEGLSKGKYKFFTSSDRQSKFIDKYTQDGEFLIFATGGHAGIHYCNEKFATSTDCFIAKVDDKIMAKYVYYYLFSRIQILEDGFKGAGLKHISKGYIEDINIIYPENKETQKKIISIIEKAEKSKEWRKEADDLTEDFLKSVFLEMFGDPVNNPKKWEFVETQELFHMKLGKMLSAKNYTGKHLKPYLRNVNVNWGYLDLSSINEMDFDEKDFIKYQLKKGDILVCEGGEVGRTAIYNGEINNCCYQNALHRLRIKDNRINSNYFVYYMMFAVKYGLILREIIQVTIAHFTQDKFKKFKIMLPPIELQNKFASVVKEVEAIKEQQKHSKNHIDKLFNALMQKAFRGELNL